jgi:hypothetical protein
MVWNSPFFGKITGHFSPTVLPFPFVEVVALGGASGNFQSRDGTVSL